MKYEVTIRVIVEAPEDENEGILMALAEAELSNPNSYSFDYSFEELAD